MVRRAPNEDHRPGGKDVPAFVRLLAARVAQHVVDEGRTFSDAVLSVPQLDMLSVRDGALAKEIALGVIRWYWTLEDVVRRLVRTRVRNKDKTVFFLILVGLYQLKFLRTPAHAAVDSTVQACVLLEKPWSKGFVNGVLRGYLRKPDAPAGYEAPKSALTAHPDWLCARLIEAWPQHWERIIEANNGRPPMCLRVNQRRITRDDYLQRLQETGLSAGVDPQASCGIILFEPVAVEALPGFNEGWVSVQDTAAQRVVPLMDLQPGHRVLDACAAPGTKTTHMLEWQPDLSRLVAVDISAARLERLQQTLKRLRMTAQCVVADAIQVEKWWDGSYFDRILIDAPCSGFGVIRRHPDIKHNRRPGDLPNQCEKQAQLLESLWPLLDRDGSLTYVTCSVLPEENQDQIRAFLNRHPDARAERLTDAPGFDCGVGRQTLPGIHDMDGFFYAKILRCAV